MSHSHQTTNLHDARVYHKLTQRQGRAWCLPGPLGEDVRRKMAAQLAKMYPQNGCGVCSATMKLIAYVSPRAELRMLLAPFKVIPISAISNKPAEKDCPCQSFWDPEVRGPWSKRGTGKHHPMCQYKPTAARVFSEMFQAKNGGVVLDASGKAQRQGTQVKVRPDLMLQVERKILGS